MQHFGLALAIPKKMVTQIYVMVTPVLKYETAISETSCLDIYNTTVVEKEEYLLVIKKIGNDCCEKEG